MSPWQSVWLRHWLRRPLPRLPSIKPQLHCARATWIAKSIDLKTAAYELDIASPQVLQQAIETNRTLRQLGLEPLVQDSAIQRASWEQIQGDRSLFQQVASELGLGSPLR
jgi:hypothetical protein